MKTIFISLFLLSVFSVSAQNVIQDKSAVKVDFKIKNFGSYVQGKFTDVKMTSNFDENNLEESYIKAIIKTVSITTGNKKRDKHLLKEDFFNVNMFSEIILSSTEIEKIDNHNYKMTANLTIKETTKNVVIPLQILENGDTLNIQSNFSLNRIDYGVGGRSWVLSNTVKIQVLYTVKK